MPHAHKKRRISFNNEEDSNDKEDTKLLASLDALTDADLRLELERRTTDATGLTPHSFQLDAAVALWRNRDLIVIAGTGRGKTLSFIMPCSLTTLVTVLVISPLNALMDDQVRLGTQFLSCKLRTQHQARRFREWGLWATSVNAGTLQNNRYLLKVSG
jgi:ATP-dependent helicase YprA (DUF1998 family)